MTFNEINKSIYLHFTLNDIPLFMKSKKEADRVSKLVTTRNVDREAERIRRLIQMGEIQASDVDSEIEARMGEVFSENFSTVLDENQDSIDLDKYLLTAAYRIYRLIEILEDPNNRRRFPPFDTFKQYEKLYAESLIKINEELGDKEFDINYEATKGANPTGFWNELTQRCESVEFSRQDLRELIESPLIQKVLNREEEELDQEDKKGLSSAIVLQTKNPTAMDIAGDFKRKTSSAVVSPRRYSEDKTFSGLPADAMEMMMRRRDERIAEQERERRIIFEAIRHGGLVEVGKNKYVAVFEDEEVDLKHNFMSELRESAKKDFREYIEELQDEITVERAVDLFSKLDILLGFSGNDREIDSLIDEAAGLIKAKMESDGEFRDEYKNYTDDFVYYSNDSVTYEYAYQVLPTAYVEKYGEKDALLRRYNELKKVNQEKLIKLYHLGIIDFEILNEVGLFSELSHKDLFEYKDKGMLTEQDVADIMYASVSGLEISKEDYLVQVYTLAKTDKKGKGYAMSRRYFELLSKKSALKLFAEGKLDENDLRRKGVTVDDLDALDKETYLALISSDKLPRNLRPTEEKILDKYGDLISGEELIKLAEKKIISDEAIIKSYLFRQGVSFTNPDIALKAKDISDFYTIDRLLELEKEGKLNPNFIELYRKGLVDNLFEDERKEYIDNMISRLKEVDLESGEIVPEYLRTLYRFYKLGMLPKENIKTEFTDDGIIDLHLEDRLSEEDVLEYYAEGFVSKDIISEMFSEKDIEDLIKAGKISSDCVMLLGDRKAKCIKELLENKKVNVSDVMRFYLSDNGININDLEEVLENEDLENVVLSEFIKEGTSEEKIEELFKCYYISQDELGELVARGILSKEKEQELSDYLNSHQEFEKIFGAKRLIANLSKETDGFGEGHTRGVGSGNPQDRRIKIDPELQREFLRRAGADSRVIHLSGTNNSLDGYEIYGFEKEGVMVFGKFDSPNNSTYIMTIAQGSYFLKAIERKMARMQEGKEGQDVELESSATKQELRDTEHVKVRNASKGWGKNILDSMAKLSPKMAERLKKDKTYKTKLDEIIQDIREDYEIRKEIY